MCADSLRRGSCLLVPGRAGGDGLPEKPADVNVGMGTHSAQRPFVRPVLGANAFAQGSGWKVERRI